MSKTIYELSENYVYVELSLLFAVYIMSCLTVYCAYYLRKRFFHKNNLSSKQSLTLVSVMFAIFFLLVLHSYKLMQEEIKFLNQLGDQITLKAVKGSLINMHSYSDDWDLVHFQVGEQTFYYRLENIGRFDFNLTQRDLESFEGHFVAIEFTESSRIVSFKVLNKNHL